MSGLTQARLRELLRYDAATGEFVRLVRVANQVAGKAAGCPDLDGYVMITIDRVSYKAHRLAWFYTHGEWPPFDVDHINGVPSDNRLVNLRTATRSENMQNLRTPNSGNKSGFLGVSRNGGRWFAQITLNRKRRHLGYFATPEEAHAAYVAAKREHHPGGML